MHALSAVLCTNASLVKYKSWYGIILVAPCKPFMFGVSVTEWLLTSYHWCQDIQPRLVNTAFCNAEVVSKREENVCDAELNQY